MCTGAGCVSGNWVRGHAAQAIYRISKDAKDALPVLLDCLKDDDEHVRLGVIHALGMMRKDARPAMDAIRKSLKDHVAWIRLAASGALWDIAPEPRDALAKELRSEEHTSELQSH